MFHGARSMRFATVRVVAATLVIGLATFVTVLPAQVAGAAGDVVSTCAGSGPGSLPAVVGAAASGDTITFSVTCPASSPITLASTIDINTNLTINGPGANDLAVSGNNTVEVFDVASGVTDTISGITIEDGLGGIANSGRLTVTNTTVEHNHISGSGGGIYNDSSLTVSDSAVSHNSASDQGGGIFSNAQALAIINSTVSDNVALEGGGVVAANQATINGSTITGNTANGGDGGGVYSVPGTSQLVTITYSTISGNTASGPYEGAGGGGIYIGQMPYAIVGSTIADNKAVSTNGGEYSGGGIFNVADTATITDSTISGNTASYDGGGVFNDSAAYSNSIVRVAGTITSDSASGGDCVGTITDEGYNLDDDGSCGFTAANGSESDVDPDLGPLQDNGGPTETQAPALGSPVLNRIPVGTTANGVTLCPGTDQRGVARPQGTECDIGAVELVIPKAITSPNRATDTAGSRFSFTIDTSGTPVPKITEKGALPKRLNFTDNADGTATISGKTKTTGVYHLTITATFGKGTSKYVVSQAFTLTVNSA